MQDMQEKTNKDMETLKSNQSETNNLLSPPLKKNLYWKLGKRMEQVENRVLGMKDKVKTKPMNHGCRRRRGGTN
jgi:hypothetical protein